MVKSMSSCTHLSEVIGWYVKDTKIQDDLESEAQSFSCFVESITEGKEKAEIMGL